LVVEQTQAIRVEGADIVMKSSEIGAGWAKVQAQLEQLKRVAPPVVAGDADDPSLSGCSTE